MIPRWNEINREGKANIIIGQVGINAGKINEKRARCMALSRASGPILASAANSKATYSSGLNR